MGTFDEEFYKRISKTDICWNWIGNRNSEGYGIFKGHLAHRVAFLNAYNRLDKDKLICHRCDNPSCVRPDHLFEGTYFDNSKDCYAKGRSNIDKVRNYTKRSYVNRKLSGEQVNDIRNSCKNGTRQVTMIKKHNLTRSCVSSIVNYRTYKDVILL